MLTNLPGEPPGVPLETPSAKSSRPSRQFRESYSSTETATRCQGAPATDLEERIAKPTSAPQGKPQALSWGR